MVPIMPRDASFSNVSFSVWRLLARSVTLGRGFSDPRLGGGGGGWGEGSGERGEGRGVKGEGGGTVLWY